ncbi:MAG: class IV adenylate cyclase [Anaerolineales bacterium]|nr:class IV adenylate cyclase [Anaerolineales bacterium]
MNGQEIEAKFYAPNFRKIKAQLTALNATLIQPRTHEINLRFDTFKRELRKQGKVLRLRQDQSAKLTFKGPSQSAQGVASRQEIEFEIADFAAGQKLIEALGFEVVFFYEKHRAIYELNNTQIMLDEMPYGNFVEIEGRSLKSVQKTARLLELDLSKAVKVSYHALFERVASAMKLNADALSFKTFKRRKPTEKELGVEKAY